MSIYIFYKPNSKTKTITELENLKIFQSITQIDKKNILLLEYEKPLYDNNKIIKARIKKNLTAISTINSSKFVVSNTKKYGIKNNMAKNKKNKIRHIFFDIDSTLTHTGISSLNRNVKDMFLKFMDYNCTLYFCTGRAYQDVKKLIKMYNTSNYAIAENGGLIIGSSLPSEKYGDRTEPDKLLNYMSNENIKFKLDPAQQSRKTEHVLKKSSISINRLSAAIKKSKLSVEIHASKNTYHITKKGINKGTALEYLASENELGLGSQHEIIAIGDSDLDIPMFKFADTSYAVKNADSNVKKNAKYRLKNNAPKAIEELYKRLFLFG